MAKCRLIFHFASVGISLLAWMRREKQFPRATLPRIRMLDQLFPTECRTKYVLPGERQQRLCRGLRIQSPDFPPAAGFVPPCPGCPLRPWESALAFLSLGLESRP